MEFATSTSTTTTSAPPGGGGGGGPAPFLVKTYEMVDDTSTDDIVSWSLSQASFIVWNPPEFSKLLLPTYFKHNNFSSFIRQLNTYGFHKIDPEKWEFANEDFVKGKRHLLKNIHRRKPIHSHSHPPPDPERAGYEEELEKLTREKNDLDSKVSGFRMQESIAKAQLEDIRQRLSGMEQRQESLLTFLQKAVQDHAFVERLSQKIEAMDLSAYNKKRRVPITNHILSTVHNNFGDIQSNSRTDVASIYQQDVSSKLKLELSTAVSNMNLVSNSTHSSNVEWASPPRKSLGLDLKDAETGLNSLPFTTGPVELSDTGTRVGFKMDSLTSEKVGAKECPRLHSLQQSLMLAEESDGHICCQLNLSLASSPIQANQSASSGKITQMDLDVSGSALNDKDEIRVASINNLRSGQSASSSQEAQRNNEDATPATPPRVNDHFWEQFLTERPGASDTEEASSCYRDLPHDEQEDRGSSHGMTRAAKNLGRLTL